MALRKLVERITKPTSELDREELAAFCDELGLTPMDEIVPRSPCRVGGEVKAVRIVPRAGADALEATVSDGRGQVVAVFLGRRKVAGVTPGRRLVLEGVLAEDGNRLVVYNPVYTLLP